MNGFSDAVSYFAERQRLREARRHLKFERLAAKIYPGIPLAFDPDRGYIAAPTWQMFECWRAGEKYAKEPLPDRWWQLGEE